MTRSLRVRFQRFDLLGYPLSWQRAQEYGAIGAEIARRWLVKMKRSVIYAEDLKEVSKRIYGEHRAFRNAISRAEPVDVIEFFLETEKFTGIEVKTREESNRFIYEKEPYDRAIRRSFPNMAYFVFTKTNTPKTAKIFRHMICDPKDFETFAGANDKLCYSVKPSKFEEEIPIDADLQAELARVLDGVQSSYETLRPATVRPERLTTRKRAKPVTRNMRP
jgi:hypothetical protein